MAASLTCAGELIDVQAPSASVTRSKMTINLCLLCGKSILFFLLSNKLDGFDNGNFPVK